MPLLEIADLQVSFKSGRRQEVRAVDGVSLAVASGESVGLVGESGCGKSTLGNTILRLVPACSGQIRFENQDVLALGCGDLFRYRRRAQMIFQDPYGSLNPRLTIGAAIEECLAVHRLGNRLERRERVRHLLETVGLESDYAARYPHEFSGGQRQRVGIARALALDPVFIVADEPVSALDVSVQAQILNLLKDLQLSRNLAYLFIAHDLSVVRYMCSRVLVMYFGRIVEAADAAELFAHPAHPYTRTLLAAVPDIERGLRAARARSAVAQGEVPSVSTAVEGCSFHPRCPYAEEICREQTPKDHEVSPGHTSRCHFAGTIRLHRGMISQ
ncbi:MAG: ABC transporter ATP-binding protein [Lentisphaerae bacterium]|nr:ABC transporter ATP-binding protein [Lentisphaerota bacterium]